MRARRRAGRQEIVTCNGLGVERQRGEVREARLHAAIGHPRRVELLIQPCIETDAPNLRDIAGPRTEGQAIQGMADGCFIVRERSCRNGQRRNDGSRQD
jgi:hypothetical protein